MRLLVFRGSEMDAANSSDKCQDQTMPRTRTGDILFLGIPQLAPAHTRATGSLCALTDPPPPRTATWKKPNPRWQLLQEEAELSLSPKYQKA